MDLSPLQSRLPAIRKWIDTTVEEHRAAARPLSSFGFARLGHYFDAQTLKRASVVEVDVVPKPPLTVLGLHQFADFEQLNGAGLTYGNVYFVVRTRANDESLHFHELVHTIQWHTLGVDRFILAYALGHLAGGGYEQPIGRDSPHARGDIYAGAETVSGGAHRQPASGSRRAGAIESRGAITINKKAGRSPAF